jgi:hypothetical protein
MFDSLKNIIRIINFILFYYLLEIIKIRYIQYLFNQYTIDIKY